LFVHFAYRLARKTRRTQVIVVTDVEDPPFEREQAYAAAQG